jgi:hypothetical protein
MEGQDREAILEVLRLPQPGWQAADDRLAVVEDRQAIHEVIMRYGYISDEFLWEDLLQLYTEDIERVLSGTLDEVIRGKDALRRALQTPRLPRRSETGSDAHGMQRPMVIGQFGSRHLITGVVVRLAPDRRTARAVAQYALVVEVGEGVALERGTHEGSYVFDFRKDDENGWRFSRQMIITNTARNPVLSGRY